METNSELVEEYLMLLERFRRESLLAEHFLQKSYWTRTNTDTHTHMQTYTHSFISILQVRGYCWSNTSYFQHLLMQLCNTM